MENTNRVNTTNPIETKMKATGIIRRVDDLGRVVIPKEIRKTMMITEGDALELYTTPDGVCFKKYDSTANLMDLMNMLDDFISDIDVANINKFEKQLNFFVKKFENIKEQKINK